MAEMDKMNKMFKVVEETESAVEEEEGVSIVVEASTKVLKKMMKVSRRLLQMRTRTSVEVEVVVGDVAAEEEEVEGEERVVKVEINRGRTKDRDATQVLVGDVEAVVEIDHRPGKLKTKTEKGLNNNDQ